METAYDVAMMLGDLVLIFLFFWFLINLGFAILEQLYTADARLIQEYTSGYLSMGNFAPDSFNSNQTFPRVSHILTVLADPQLVSIKVGSGITSSSQVGENLFETAINVVFTPRVPLGYLLSGMIPKGSCVSGCMFSAEKYNVLSIEKNGNELNANLFRK
ncbi:MAG: hypothetical protein WA139_04055 [Candidatus Aenigmatarchaeota archaeon]